jgi:prevent-host-death family protein
MSWSNAEARANLPALLRSLEEGPQVITVRGREVAAVVDIADRSRPAARGGPR